MTRPLIGIPTQTLQAIDDIPKGLPHSWVMNSRYSVAMADAGAAPLMIPLLSRDLESLRAVFERVDGILLAGGVDMDPCTFGETAHPKLGAIDPDRDTVELALARWAIEEKKPILGLCRGHQVLNVALGGTLWQDIESQVPGAIKHDYFPTAGYARDFKAHPVDVVAGSRLEEAFGEPAIHVNSMHHQAVKELAPPLRASGRAPDGLIEAFESGNDHFLVGVQWHPEMFERSDRGTHALFQQFVAAASR